MKKKIYPMIAAVLCIVLFTACGRKNEVIGSELAQEFCQEVPFAEALTEIDSSSAVKLLYLNPNDYSEIVMYIGTQSTCDEFAIIKTNTPDTVVDKLQSYLSKVRSDYMTYRPAEANKADNAFITSYKGTVVMVVCSAPGTAEQVFKNYLKK